MESSLITAAPRIQLPEEERTKMANPCWLRIVPQPTQHGVFPRPNSPGPELRIGLAGPARHRPLEEAGQAPSAEVAARSRPRSFPLGGRASLVSSYTGRRHSHASPSPTWSLETPATQMAFETFTATPADLHLLQSICRPQFTAYAFIYALGLISCH
ncbi:hypothetical protein SRHO_G00090120 [Serrasalmus rhombeus]